jgi:hypothetical protein
MDLKKLIRIFSQHKCISIYAKRLSPNDNSKNQVYVAGDFSVLSIFPLSEITVDKDGERKTLTYKSKLEFLWVDEDANLDSAPYSQFILYPEYPEVRFSGFLKNCKNAPSELMTSRESGRYLFLGITPERKIIGFVSAASSELSKEVTSSNYSSNGVFVVIPIIQDTKNKLIQELKRINELGWIDSKRLDKHGNIITCNAPQCGGYTLEAELGIIPNGKSEPDYLGWEIKQFKVSNFEKFTGGRVTLMTPEPDDGFYVDQGVQQFLRTYGYPDKKIADRINFGGTHYCGKTHSTTKLKLDLIGFDAEKSVITNPNGGIYLMDQQGNNVASWSFLSILSHWNKKHEKACYVPSKTLKIPSLKYSYGNKIMLGTVTDPTLFLKQISLGNVFYDPGIKLENASTKPKDKRRSQFRINPKHISSLYSKNDIVNLNA